ncbi:MAG: phytoene desaturase family protein [Vicinamibacterales bacterium]
MTSFDAVVIGGGVNGLTCAGLLAKRGLKIALVEQRDTLGGCAAESDLTPGFRVPTLAHSTGPVRRDVVDELQLRTHGLRFIDSAIDVCALSMDGRAVVIAHDAARTAAGLRVWSEKDADAWPSFSQSLRRISHVVGTLLMQTPPSVDDPSARDLWSLMHTLRAFRGLPKADKWQLLRWGPMAVADLVSEHVETELLRATLAADGVFGAMLGPWSAGSGLQWLLAASNRSVAWPGGWSVAGGPVALATALTRAAGHFDVTILTGNAAKHVEVANDRATAVTLASGERITARAVVSGVDPKRTFLCLCDADHLPPEFLWRMKHYRSRGTLAKVNLALSALPTFTGATREMLAGRVRLAPDLDYLERAFDHAKYGRFSPHPWIELTIPSLIDPSLAPNGAHVLSAYAQFAPYELRRHAPSPGALESSFGGTRAADGKRQMDRTEDAAGASAPWDAQRDALGDAVINTLEQYAPGLRDLIVQRQVLTPLDLERGWGLTGGQVFQGELSLDQFFTMRPILGYGQYRTPIRGLYLCGSGSHPGTGLTGGSGANAAREIARDLV